MILCAGMGCSTRKNSRGSRVYHELTTRYNVFYNAEQAYLEILDDQLEDFTDDYTLLLPYFPSPHAHSSSSSPSSSPITTGGPFDPVIVKMEKAIREHSISAKPRRDPTRRYSPEYRLWLQQNEFNPFIHQAWLLMGKAHVQNGDPARAIAIFNETIRLFGQQSEAASEARLWMARAYIDWGRLFEAEQTLFAIRSSELSPQLQELYHEVQAYYCIQNGEYTAALPFLQQAINAEKRIKQKRRLQFLLGQIYTVLGEKERADQAFQATKSLSTPRELAQQATAYQAELLNNSDSLAVQLSRGLHIPSSLLANEIHGKQADLDQWRTTEQVTGFEDGDDPWTFLRGRSIRDNSFHYARAQGEATKSTPLLFSEVTETPHVVLWIPDRPEIEKDGFHYTVSRFHFDRYRLRSFDLAFLPFLGTEALVVRSFSSFEEAHRYIRVAEAAASLQASLPDETRPLIISESNLNQLLQGGSIESYLTFLTSTYGIDASFQPIADSTVFNEKESSVPQNIVPLRAAPIDEPQPASPPSLLPPVTPEALKERLEENEARALRQAGESGIPQSREQLLKERERQRQERIKERQRELKKRAQEREARLKQRERERQQLIKKRRSQ